MSRVISEKRKDADRRYREEHKAAIADRVKAWKARNRDKVNAACKRWQAKNKDKRKAYDALRIEERQIKNRLRRYGLVEEQYQKLVADQNGKCAMCFKLLGKRPHTDHDHATDKVRGILCAGCNHGLGYIEKPGFVEMAQAYLARGFSYGTHNPTARQRSCAGNRPNQ